MPGLRELLAHRIADVAARHVESAAVRTAIGEHRQAEQQSAARAAKQQMRQLHCVTKPVLQLLLLIMRSELHNLLLGKQSSRRLM